MKVTDNAHYVALHLDFVTVSWNLNNQSLGEHSRDWPAGAPLTYFNDGGVWRIFLGLTFWPKGIFLGLWKTPGFFGSQKQHRDIFWILYFSSAQINNNISAIYSFVFDQIKKPKLKLACFSFPEDNNKICWCKNTEGFFWVDKFWSWDIFGYKIWTSVGPPRQ